MPLKMFPLKQSWFSPSDVGSRLNNVVSWLSEEEWQCNIPKIKLFIFDKNSKCIV